MNVLLLISPVFAGYMKDTTDSYDLAFMILAGFNLMGGVLFLFAGKPALKPAGDSQAIRRAARGTR